MERNLTGFLAQNVKKVDTEQVICSPRMTEGGKPVLWEIGCITAGENNALRGSCLKPGRGGDLQFDTGLYQAKLCARCTRFPPLGDAELQDSYGVQTAEDLLLTMLTPGEFEDYAQRVLEINGFQSEREMAEEAKN